MKLKLILFTNAFLAFAAIITTLIESDDFLSSILLVFFTQVGALIATVKYYHTKNILKVAGDVGSLRSDLGKNNTILLTLASVVLFVSSVFFFEVKYFYQIVILASACVAILSVASLYITMYPILVKFSAGIYKKMSD